MTNLERTKLFEHIQTLIDMSPGTANKILSAVLSDAYFYDAILVNPSYFIEHIQSLQSLGDSTVGLSLRPLFHGEHITEFNETEICILLQTLDCILSPLYRTIESARNILNATFAAIHPSIPKFEKYYRFTEHTQYRISRFDQFESMKCVLDRGTCKAIIPRELIWNENITPDHLFALITNYRDALNAGMTMGSAIAYGPDNSMKFTTNGIKKYIMLYNYNLCNELSRKQILERITPECDIDITYHFLRDFCLGPNPKARPHSWEWDYSVVYWARMFDKCPKLGEKFIDDADLIREFATAKASPECYKFLLHKELRGKLTESIIKGMNDKNTKLYIDIDNMSPTEIVDYINIFGRRTTAVSGIGIDNTIKRNRQLFIICCQNGIKLSKSSECFHEAEMWKQTIWDEWWADIHANLTTYGCNSRVLLEWAYGNNQVNRLLEQYIEGEDLIHRYHKYLVEVI